MDAVTPPPSNAVRAFRVGLWLAEPALNRLSHGATTLHVRPQLMDVLTCLARHAGQVVLKDALLAEVWPDRVITESGIARCIAELRQLLGDHSREPAYIETIAKRGYRLVAPVTWVDEPPPGRGDAAAAVDTGARTDVGASPAAAPAPATWTTARRVARWGVKVSAAAVLLTVVAIVAFGYFGRRAATGTRALTGADTVVLAFDNLTGDKVFDETLPLALAIQLEQTPYLRLLSNERIREVLGQMQRPAETPVDRALGLEVCERAGATVLVAASVTPLGQRFVIGFEAVACAGGEILARRQIEAQGAGQVLEAIGRAASQLRKALGESDPSLATYGVPITEGTTRSLPALRALRRGDAARARGDSPEALRFYREAAAADPDFALAQLRLGSSALAQHFEAEGVAAILKAYALRDRVTFPERLEIDYGYHAVATGDRIRIREALETMSRVYPTRLSGRRRLAGHYLDTGFFAEALVEARAARDLAPNQAANYTMLGRAYLATNQLANARQVLEEAVARGIASESTHATLLHIGFQLPDPALVERERAWAATRAEAQPEFLEAEAEEALWRGRLRDALECLDRYQEICRQRQAEYRWIVLELRKARYEALAGFSARAMARVERQLARGDELGDDLKTDALKVAVSAGDMTRANRLIAGFDAEGWPRVEEPFAGFVTAYRAAIENDRGRPQAALALLAPLEPYELGLSWGFIPLHERARAHLRAGQWQQARDAYQKMLDHPGVYPGQKLLPLAQLGVARALTAGGQPAAAAQAYDAFLALWRHADADLPLLAAARRERAALAGR